MTTQNANEAVLSGRELQISNVGRIPASVHKLIQATPKKEWSKIRAYLIGSEEEGELIEMLPVVNRVMTICLHKMAGRVRKHEITGDQLDEGYQQLHDAIHGLRQKLYALIILAGFKDPEKKDSKPEETAPGAETPAADLAPVVSPVKPVATGRF